jgi:hypothetical protein
LPSDVPAFAPFETRPAGPFGQRLKQAKGRHQQGGAAAHNGAYQTEAEQYFQYGYIIGSGDKTFAVKDQLKRMGCKWHAVRERWVAPNAEILKAAKACVQAGLPDTPEPPQDPLRQKIRDKFRNTVNVQATAGQIYIIDPGEDIPLPAVKSKRLPPPPPDRAALLLALEERGVIELPPGRMATALGDEPPSVDELEAAFAKADKAFEL